MVTHGNSGRKAKRTKKEGEEEVLHYFFKENEEERLRIFKPPLQEHYQAAADKIPGTAHGEWGAGE